MIRECINELGLGPCRDSGDNPGGDPPAQQAEARERIWTPDKEKPKTEQKLWTPGS